MIYPPLQQVKANYPWRYPELWECSGVWCPGVNVQNSPSGPTLYDWMGRAPNLTANGPPTWGNDSKYGFKTLSFAASQWLTGPTASYLNGGAGISISAWHNFTGTFTGGNYAIASKSGSLSDGWVLYLSNTAPAFGANISGVGIKIATSSITLTANSGWHHILGVYDGATLKVYTDGVLGATVSQVGTIAPSTTAFSIGALYNTSGANFVGPLDDVRVYPWALTAGHARFLASVRGIAWQLNPLRIATLYGTTLAALTANLSQSLGLVSLAASALVAINLTETNTLADDSLSSASTVAVASNTSQPLGSENLSAASTAAISASESSTLGATSESASSTAAVSASTSQTLSSETLSAAAAVAVSASESSTLSNESLSANAAVAISGSTAQTLGSESLSASGDTAVSAAVNQSLSGESLSGSGTAAIAASGSGSVAESLVGSGVASNNANLSQSLRAESLSASAAVQIASALSQALSNQSVAAVSTSGIAAILSESLGDVGISAVATVTTNAALLETLDQIGLSSTWTNAGVMRHAILVQTLQDVRLVALAGKVVLGPFRVLESQLTVPGAVLTEIKTPGSQITEITIPGSLLTQITTPGPERVQITIPGPLITQLIAQDD